MFRDAPQTVFYVPGENPVTFSDGTLLTLPEGIESKATYPITRLKTDGEDVWLVVASNSDFPAFIRLTDDIVVTGLTLA